MSIKHRVKRLEQKLAPGRIGALLLMDPTEKELEEAKRKNPRAILIWYGCDTEDTADGADED